MFFPVVMYGCESWTVKKAEHWRIDAFELWCWRGLLRVPWTARRCNQSILKEISPGIPLEGLMLKLKLQYFGHLMQRVDSLEKTLMLGGIGGRRRRGRQSMRWLDDITDSMGHEFEWTPGVGDGQGGLACCDSWGGKALDMTELNWTDTYTPPFCTFFPLGHHRVLSRVPCGMQYILISYLTYSINSVYVSIPVSEFFPPPPFPLIQEKCIYFLYTYGKNV